VLAALAYAALHFRYGTSAAPPVVTSGVATVGRPFKLIDQYGKTVSSESFRGRAQVIYFGWSNDPDLTPAALQILTAALASKALAGRRLQPIFITLDPQQDQPGRLARFLGAYHPTLVGLTGTESEIIDLASAYKLYWKRIVDASLPQGYSIDFASHYYVTGASGDLLGVVPHTTNAMELAEEIDKMLR
jgi:protein SCO1/2